MKRILRIVWRGALVLAALVAAAAGCEDLWLRYQMAHGTAANLFEQVAIIEAGEVKGGKLEYYMDQPQIQECVHAIFPHFGNAPCWYLKRHTTKLLSRREWPGVQAAAARAGGIHATRSSKLDVIWMALRSERYTGHFAAKMPWTRSIVSRFSSAAKMVKAT
ncbi:MAG TPA: hypothetical protein VJX29_05890 [Candidatus Acidoferrales bacterium]|nr:hypothetical protein [Candidatus Acidoferrales bacterium]